MKHASPFTILRFRLLAGLGILLAVFLGWAATDRAAQNQEPNKEPPKKDRREEEEDVPAKRPPSRKIRIEDEDPSAKPARPGINPTADFAQLAREAKNPAVAELYRKLVVPHDLITARKEKGEGELTRPILPLEKFYGADHKKYPDLITITQLDADFKPMPSKELPASAIKEIEPYEHVALRELDRFLDKTKLGDYEKLVVEEQLISAILRFHGSAKESGQRKGEEWGPIGNNLRVRLIDVLLKQLVILTDLNDWDSAFALAMRLAESFPGEGDQQQIAPKILSLLQKALNANKTPSLNANHLRDLHLRLRALTSQFPKNLEIQKLNKNLKEQAEKLFAEGKRLCDAKNPSKQDLETADQLFQQAQDIWPTLEGVDQYRSKNHLQHPILRVGVRQLPRNMSPHTALTDTEHRAVEMLFESLVKFSPDVSGWGRYHPDLAEGQPLVIDLGRQFQLSPNARWSDGKVLDIVDVRNTLHALREGRGPDHSLAWENLYSEKEVTSGGDFQINVNLNKGYIEPLALMNTKIVPGIALQRGQADKFGQKPIGSGPFVFEGLESESGATYAKFSANTKYGARASKLGLPRFSEVRFFVYSDALAEVEKHHLSILLDLTPKEAAEIKDNSDRTHFKVNLPDTHQPNHRVYFLAVNHRKPVLEDENLRAALSQAIDREKLLDTHFRGKLGREIHKAINSPYPANCWACDPSLRNLKDKNSCDPYDSDGAKAKFREFVTKKQPRDLTLTLKYPAGEPLKSAMEELASQVSGLLSGFLNVHVTIELKPESMQDLRDAVEKTFDYDLAYYHYDFPDDTFWLGPLFAPRKAGDDAIPDENLFGYKSDKLYELLQKSIDYREFTKVRNCTRDLHQLLAREVPVIPLWQLDPLHAIHQEVRTVPFDPQRVFTDIEKWQLEGPRK